MVFTCVVKPFLRLFDLAFPGGSCRVFIGKFLKEKSALLDSSLLLNQSFPTAMWLATGKH
jgi:hypothetical protein